MAADGRVAKRLSSYWQLEIANAVLVPAAFVIIPYQLGGGVS